MNNKVLKSVALMLVLMFATPFSFAQADSRVNILQTHVVEQTLIVITDCYLQTAFLQCSVSNQSAEIIDAFLLSDEQATIKTTLLIDVSSSMPSDMRETITSALRKLIENKPTNEQFALIVFSDEINLLQDFTSDRYDLVAAVDKIMFDGNKSMIYDAIYNTTPEMNKTISKETFYRTIVITDGIDDAVSGITKEELYVKLQNESYPVDIVAVGSREGVENKDLAAIVRMSAGRYNSLNPSTDVAVLVQALGVNKYFCFAAKVPSAFLDGTTRQVDINDGAYNASIDVKFPVYNASVVDTQHQTTTDETVTPKSLASLFGKYTIVIFVGVALLIIVAIIIAIAVARGKKSKTTSRPHPIVPAGYGEDSYVEKTEFVREINFSDSQYTIKLSNPNDPSKTWTLPITGDLLIGRAEHCPVRLDDKSVSREQCKIMVQRNGLVVVHMGLTNKTSLNGSSVVGNSPIQSGDTLKFGRVALRIDYIQTLGSPPPKLETPRNQESGKTESIF